MDMVNKEELLLRGKGISRSIKDHSKNLRMGRCFKDMKNSTFHKEV